MYVRVCRGPSDLMDQSGPERRAQRVLRSSAVQHCGVRHCPSPHHLHHSPIREQHYSHSQHTAPSGEDAHIQTLSYTDISWQRTAWVRKHTHMHFKSHQWATEYTITHAHRHILPQASAGSPIESPLSFSLTHAHTFTQFSAERSLHSQSDT